MVGEGFAQGSCGVDERTFAMLTRLRKRILNYRLTPLLFSGFLLESEHGAGSRARVVAGAGG